MNLLITLLIAHLFADFPLQTNTLARLKEKHWQGVLLHTLVHVIVTALLINHSYRYWPLLFGIGVIHFAIDGMKLICPAKKGLAYFLVDQVLHLATLLLAAYLAQQWWTPAPTGILPDEWLLPIFAGAAIPALMVLLWVWTNTLSQEYVAKIYLLSWAKYEILTIEQRIGLVIIGIAFSHPALHSLGNLVQAVGR